MFLQLSSHAHPLGIMQGSGSKQMLVCPLASQHDVQPSLHCSMLCCGLFTHLVCLPTEVDHTRGDLDLRLSKLDQLHSAYQDALGLRLHTQDGEQRGHHHHCVIKPACTTIHYQPVMFWGWRWALLLCWRAAQFACVAVPLRPRVRQSYVCALFCSLTPPFLVLSCRGDVSGVYTDRPHPAREAPWLFSAGDR